MLALGTTLHGQGQEAVSPPVNVLEQLVEMDADGDGMPEYRYTIANTYDQHGTAHNGAGRQRELRRHQRGFPVHHDEYL